MVSVLRLRNSYLGIPNHDTKGESNLYNLACLLGFFSKILSDYYNSHFCVHVRLAGSIYLFVSHIKRG